MEETFSSFERKMNIKLLGCVPSNNLGCIGNDYDESNDDNSNTQMVEYV